MLPHRFTSGQSSVNRKSRLEGKPSLLPKPRRAGSTDRLSTETRRPSTTGHRSSSAEPARGTIGPRLSREASATKLPLNGRSRSQNSEARYGHASTTPRTSHYMRPTTPVRTPSGDRSSRSWQASLERALAFVTVKDQRAISNVAWQRAECSRVVEALAARGGGGKALVRPLTITQFVLIVGELLAAVSRDSKLNNDNYVTKLPHLSKRLLYPGAVSKSWLRTVNTLHAFPHALALIAYLLDLVSDIEAPVCDEWLYVGKDELARLRRDYLHRCWIRFQDPGHQFEDLNEEYLQDLKSLLGNDEEKIAELQNVIKKYEMCLEDAAEAAARAEEERLRRRREALVTSLRDCRAAAAALRTRAAAAAAARGDARDAAAAADVDIDRATAALAAVRGEVARQQLSLEERARLLDDVDYATRVLDCKAALADNIHKMVLSKEMELALWQKKTLDSCVEYKQGLIHLSGQLPDHATLAIDENSLMEAECSARAARAAAALREHAGALAAARAALLRQRAARDRHAHARLEESRSRLSSLQASVSSVQSESEERAREWRAAAACAQQRRDGARARLSALTAAARLHAARAADAHYWAEQDALWRSRLSELKQYVEEQRETSKQSLEAARDKRLTLLRGNMAAWLQTLGE